MNKQKNQQSTQTGSKQKSATPRGNTHLQSSGAKSAGGGQNTASNALTPTTQKPIPSNHEEEISKAATLLFEHIEAQINRADTKAQLTLAADALLAGILASLGKGAASSLLSNASPVLDRLADLFTVLMFLALVCSFYWALRVVNPHLRGSKRFTLMYFSQIAQMNEHDFISTFANQSLDDLRESILAQVHTKATIAQYKFARVRWSVNFLIASLVFWAIIQLLLAFL